MKTGRGTLATAYVRAETVAPELLRRAVVMRSSGGAIGRWLRKRRGVISKNIFSVPIAKENDNLYMIFYLIIF